MGIAGWGLNAWQDGLWQLFPGCLQGASLCWPSPLAKGTSVNSLFGNQRDLWPLRHLIRVTWRWADQQKDKDILRTPPKSDPRYLWTLKHLFIVLSRYDLKTKGLCQRHLENSFKEKSKLLVNIALRHPLHLWHLRTGWHKLRNHSRRVRILTKGRVPNIRYFVAKGCQLLPPCLRTTISCHCHLSPFNK